MKSELLFWQFVQIREETSQRGEITIGISQIDLTNKRLCFCCEDAKITFKWEGLKITEKRKLDLLRKDARLNLWRS